jgi:transposase
LKNDASIEIWSLDEAMFQLHGTSCKMWVPPEVRDPVVLMRPTRKAIGYFGAVRRSDGAFLVSRCEERFNAETTFEFLKVLHDLDRDRRKVVIIDNARYHHAILFKDWLEKVKDELVLLFLPPYSPELNPIERVWKLTRRSCTHNRLFADLGELASRLDGQFEQWRNGSEALKRLCAIN